MCITVKRAAPGPARAACTPCTGSVGVKRSDARDASPLARDGVVRPLFEGSTRRLNAHAAVKTRPVAIHQSVQEEMRPWISSSCSSVAVGTAAAPHSSLMVLQPPWAAATARAITAYIVARVRVAGGPVVDAVLTSMQPYGELVARLRHTMYEAALTAHLSLMQQDTSGAQP